MHMLMNPIQMNASAALVEIVGQRGGVEWSDVVHKDSLAAHEATVASAIAQKARGESFWSLPYAPRFDEVRACVMRLKDHASDILILGIGGSSLGGQALIHALTSPAPGVPGATGAQSPRLHFVDNSDPWKLSALLHALDPSTTGVVLISKSGSTIETIAQWWVVQPWLEQRHTATLRHRIVAITDPVQGPLRALASRHTWMTLAVPPSVGGRFSVFSPVGLLPAMLAGIDVTALLDGATRVYDHALTEALANNTVAQFAYLHVAHHQLRGRAIHVLMPYADALRQLASWYVQLWAESLGKRHNLDGQVVEQGPTPLAAVGATDQHSQLQLFAEGPRDKLITFVLAQRPNDDLEIPSSHPDSVFERSALAKLRGRTLHTLLTAQQRATAQALAQDHRPSITLTLPCLDAYHVGALLAWYQAATAFAGDRYRINPFDQPGVEAGKVITFSLL
jgi:glucose-6-phosphate isomerase